MALFDIFLYISNLTSFKAFTYDIIIHDQFNSIYEILFLAHIITYELIVYTFF